MLNPNNITAVAANAEQFAERIRHEVAELFEALVVQSPIGWTQTLTYDANDHFITSTWS